MAHYHEIPTGCQTLFWIFSFQSRVASHGSQFESWRRTSTSSTSINNDRETQKAWNLAPDVNDVQVRTPKLSHTADQTPQILGHFRRDASSIAQKEHGTSEKKSVSTEIWNNFFRTCVTKLKTPIFFTIISNHICSVKQSITYNHNHNFSTNQSLFLYAI